MGSPGTAGGMSGGSAGTAGGSAGVPQIEFPGGFPGAGADQGDGADGADGDCAAGAGEVGSTEECGAGAEGDAAKTGAGGQQSEQGEGGADGDGPGGIGTTDETGEGTGAGGAGTTGGSEEDGEDGAGGVAQYPVESDAERRKRLEGVLDESIGGFDEVIMEEQQEIAKVSRNTEGFGQGDASGQSGGVGLGSQSGGGGGASGNVQVSNRAEERKSSVDDLSDAEKQARTPDDIVLVDEDIVARQLREAALAEEDPELRERLWEEYRKYTRQ